jgi:hypothetical protein
MNTDETKTVRFEISDVDSQYIVNKTYSELVPWPTLLQDFLTFLEGTGYIGVRNKVYIEESPFLTEDWTGPVHYSNNEDDWK